MKRKVIYTEGEIVGDNSIIFIEEVEPDKAGNRRAIFKCHCGNKWRASIQSVKHNSSKSCSCIKTTHGLYKHPLYNTHNMMMYRVYNPKSEKYPLYKTRLVEPYLQKVENYIEYVEALPNAYRKGLTVDRENNNLGYVRGNLRWASAVIQQSNTSVNNEYIGVSEYKKTGTYRARIKLHKKEYHIGLYDTPEWACFARNRFIVENNFPHPIQQIKLKTN